MKHSQEIQCPHCSDSSLQKNGHSENGTQRWRCNECRKSFQLTYRYNARKSKHISEEQHQHMAEKLSNPFNGLVGYKELLGWVESEFDISMKYTTLYEYTRRNFKAKLKVSRKSHIKKNEDDLTAF